MPLIAGQTVRAQLAPGWVGESNRAASSANFTNAAEIVIQSFTFVATPGARYKITALQSFQSNVAGDLIQVRIRWSVGAALTVAGTELSSALPNCDIAGKGQTLPMVATVTGLPAGTVTVGITAIRNTGTGTCSSFGDARQINVLMVELV